MLFALAINPAGTTCKVNAVAAVLVLQKYIVVTATPLMPVDAKTLAAACPVSTKTVL
jgi:hypothetical protein